MTVSFLSGSLRGNSLLSPILSYEAWRENGFHFCHNAIIRGNSNYPEFI